MQKFKICIFSPVILHSGIFPQGRNKIKVSVHNSLLHYLVSLKTGKPHEIGKPRPNHPWDSLIPGVGTRSPPSQCSTHLPSGKKEPFIWLLSDEIRENSFQQSGHVLLWKPIGDCRNAFSSQPHLFYELHLPRRRKQADAVVLREQNKPTIIKITHSIQ